MIRNPYQWTVSDVVQWMHQINFSQAEEMVKYHSINGKDLVQINDADLRFDFKMKHVAERKYLLRQVQQLKNTHSAIVDVEFQQEICSIRVQDIHTYTFEALRKDSYKFFGVSAEKSVLKDKDGLVWGGISISCLFDNELRQQEPVILHVQDEDEAPQETGVVNLLLDQLEGVVEDFSFRLAEIREAAKFVGD